MSAFDELTLGEVRVLRKEAFGGATISDDSVDPLELAGGVMWLHRRRSEPELGWLAFMDDVSIAEIKTFADEHGMSEEDGAGADPTAGSLPPTPT